MNIPLNWASHVLSSVGVAVHLSGPDVPLARLFQVPCQDFSSDLCAMLRPLIAAKKLSAVNPPIATTRSHAAPQRRTALAESMLILPFVAERHCEFRPTRTVPSSWPAGVMCQDP